MRDRLQICVRVRSERLRGLPVAREALVWSVRSLRAAGAEVPFVGVGPQTFALHRSRGKFRFFFVCDNTANFVKVLQNFVSARNT